MRHQDAPWQLHQSMKEYPFEQKYSGMFVSMTCKAVRRINKWIIQSRKKTTMNYPVPMSSWKEKEWAHDHTIRPLLSTQTKSISYRGLSQLLIKLKY
jgi:hypothetical protein